MTKISVIIAVYNTEDYLDKCLTSVCTQTIDDYEVIVVNDGSTDNSLAIIEKYASQYPFVKIIDQANGGLAAARNAGMDIATGEFITFVDSDDWIDSTMYEKMYAKAQEEQSDIVLCHTADHYPTYTVWHEVARVNDIYGITPSACNKIYRRAFVGDARFPRGLWYEDLEFSTKLFAKTHAVSAVEEHFYHCHCREESLMSNHNAERNLDLLTVFNRLRDFVKAENPPCFTPQDMDQLMINHIIVSGMNRVYEMPVSTKMPVLKEMRAYVRAHFTKGLRASQAFQNMPRNKRIIAQLNFAGMWWASRLLLRTKGAMKRG